MALSHSQVNNKDMRYRISDITVTSLGKGKSLVHSKRSGTSKVLSTSEVQLLLACRTFEALSNHAKACCQGLQHNVAQSTNTLRGKIVRWATKMAEESDIEIPVRSKEVERIKRQLSSFVEDGFLISEDDLHADIQEICNQPCGPGEESNTISAIGIATCNRTTHLERALNSYIESGRRHARNSSFVVVDDSRRADVQEETKRVLRGLQRRHDADIWYADRERRMHFADALARRTALPSELTRFALLGDKRYGMTYGSAVNALLLHAAGDLLLVADDDTVCNAARPPETNPELALTSRTEANEYWFFESREEALDAVSFANEDLLGLHEKLLGRTLSACVSEAGNADLCIDDMSARFLKNMDLPGAKVGVSFLGTVGDPGSESTLHRLFTRDGTFERLTQSASKYPGRLSTHEVLKAPVQPSISDGAYCMSTHMGLDGRTLLPPFVPVQRNCDGVFGRILKMCFREYYSGYLPYAVPHGAPERRSSTPETAFRSLEAWRANDLLINLIASFDPWPSGASGGAEGLRALGRFLENVGSYSQTAFEDSIRSAVTRATSSRIQEAERRLEEKRSAPKYWRKDMERYIATLQDAVTQREFFVPSDLEGSLEEREKMLQDLVGKFGRLLTHWPDMMEAALHLRWEGHPLALKLQHRKMSLGR